MAEGIEESAVADTSEASVTSLPMDSMTMPSVGHQTNDCNLIVNYLPWLMSQEEVRRLFSRVGAVDSCRLVKDKKTGQSLGYAFVRYRSRSMALRAIQTFNGFRIQNKTIKVSIARPRCSRLRGANVYVSGLDRTMTSSDLDDLFRPFGTIISCRVLCDERTGQSRGIAFVLFNLRSEAECAIRCLDATIPLGFKQQIRLKFATRPTTGLRRPRGFLPLTAATAIALPPLATTCGRRVVMNVAPSSGLTMMIADDVIRCNLATPTVNEFYQAPSFSRQVDSSFVARARQQKKEEAKTDGGDEQQKQPLVDSDPEDDKDDEEMTMATPCPLHPPPPLPHEATIIVRNLRSDIDESVLWRLFGPFGAVQDIRLQGDRRRCPTTNTGTKEAIVRMRSAREAASAVRAMDGARMKESNLSNGCGGELELLLMRDGPQSHQHPRCLLEDCGQSLRLGKDLHVCQGQQLSQTKNIGQGHRVEKQQQDLTLEEGFIPTASGLLATQGLLGLCQGQAIDEGLWTNEGRYALYNATPAAPWLNDLKSYYDLCSSSQPGYLGIYPQTTFHLSCS